MRGAVRGLIVVAMTTCAAFLSAANIPAQAAAQADGVTVPVALKGFRPPFSWHSNTEPGAPASAAGWDPINTVIVLRKSSLTAAESEADILAALNKESGVFWDSVGIGRNFTVGDCISGQAAAVQPGSPKESVQDFSWRTVTCHSPALINSADVTDHVRVYLQHQTGAWFLAVSAEHFCKIPNGDGTKSWHCITRNGYDAGRGELVAELKNLPGYRVSVRYAREYQAGHVPQHPLGYHTPYDGRVAVVTLVRTASLVALPYRSKGWKYRQVSHGGDPMFYKPGFDVSHWPAGQAGFGTTDGTCSWNNSTDVNTHWDPNTDMLVRHRLIFPADATGVHIAGTIDNNATVYLNGRKLQYVQSGYCAAGAIDVRVPAKDLKPHSLLAIRGHDDGDATYLDVKVTYKAG